MIDPARRGCRGKLAFVAIALGACVWNNSPGPGPGTGTTTDAPPLVTGRHAAAGFSIPVLRGYEAAPPSVLPRLGSGERKPSAAVARMDSARAETLVLVIPTASALRFEDGEPQCADFIKPASRATFEVREMPWGKTCRLALPPRDVTVIAWVAYAGDRTWTVECSSYHPDGDFERDCDAIANGFVAEG